MKKTFAIMATITAFIAAPIFADQIKIENNNSSALVLFGSSTIPGLQPAWPIKIAANSIWVQTFDHPASFHEIEIKKLNQVQADGSTKMIYIKGLCHAKFGDVFNSPNQTLTITINNDDSKPTCVVSQ
jgi:hypothetical protein